MVADGAAVAAGATITDSVLLPGAVVEERAVVANSVVMGRIGDGANGRATACSACTARSCRANNCRARSDLPSNRRERSWSSVAPGFSARTSSIACIAEGNTVDVVDDLSSGSLANLADARSAGGGLKIHTLDVLADEFAPRWWRCGRPT